MVKHDDTNEIIQQVSVLVTSKYGPLEGHAVSELLRGLLMYSTTDVSFDSRTPMDRPEPSRSVSVRVNYSLIPKKDEK